MTLSIRLLLRTIATFTVAMSFMALMLTSLQAVASVSHAQGQATATRFSYNLDKQLIQVTRPDGGTLDTRYNNDFRVTRLSLTAGAGTGGGTPPAPVNTDYSYDDDGLITQAGALAISRDQTNGLPVASSLEQITTQTTYTAFGERAGGRAGRGLPINWITATTPTGNSSKSARMAYGSEPTNTTRMATVP